MFVQVHKYQILITGCLGFLGVFFTILANGYFSRLQHKRELQSKVKSIRIAMISELEINLSSFEARIEQLKCPTNSNAHIPNSVFTDVYDNLLNEIGLLNESEMLLELTYL